MEEPPSHLLTLLRRQAYRTLLDIEVWKLVRTATTTAITVGIACDDSSRDRISGSSSTAGRRCESHSVTRCFTMELTISKYAIYTMIRLLSDLHLWTDNDSFSLLTTTDYCSPMTTVTGSRHALRRSTTKYCGLLVTMNLDNQTCELLCGKFEDRALLSQWQGLWLPTDDGGDGECQCEDVMSLWRDYSGETMAFN